jgi:hypothetical protein
MVNHKFKFKIKEVARKHNLPESIVEEMFNSQFKFYRDTVSKQPFKTLVDEDEFNELKTTYYFKYIGKFYTTYNKINTININNNKKQLRNEQS